MWSVVNAIITQAEQKLGPQSAYRGLVLLRTKRMQARIFTIDQKNLSVAQKAAWVAVRDSVKQTLGFPAAGLFKLPLYTTRDELVSFEAKLAASEKQITALNVEN